MISGANKIDAPLIPSGTNEVKTKTRSIERGQGWYGRVVNVYAAATPQEHLLVLAPFQKGPFLGLLAKLSPGVGRTGGHGARRRAL